MQENLITQKVIGAAIEVHKHLGPGLLKSVYQTCLAQEFISREIQFEREFNVPVAYKGVQLDISQRLDFLVEKAVDVEVKAIETLLPVHAAQLLTYLRLTGCKVGLLINFNVPVLKQGLKRMIL